MALIDDVRRTIYLATPGTAVGLDHDAFEIMRPEHPRVRAPVRSVDSFVCFGQVNVSIHALQRCATEGIDVSWLGRTGKFKAGLRRPTSGNVLLRVRQFAAAAEPADALAVARPVVAAKILNSRTVLLDIAKDRLNVATRLRDVAALLVQDASTTKDAATLDELRGIEGTAARRYFAELGSITDADGLGFTTRTRRPPRDPANAVLSFLYGLLRGLCEGAVEHVGLDPQVGFLHAVRPGRPALALDLMEELRAPFADRLALTMINRRQLTAHDFERQPGGATLLRDAGRRKVLTAWDAHVSRETAHRALETPIARRQVPHLQAMLLARHLRGDVAHYLPYRSSPR